MTIHLTDPHGAEASDPRTDDLAANLRLVRRRLVAACEAAGRSPEEVTLVAVTKTYPAEDVLRLASLGVTQVGENRDQEAAGKAARVAAAGTAVTWHFVGRLQRNKCRSVATYADVVHSLDSVRLVRALAAACRAREKSLDVLAQVSLDGDPARSGATPDAGFDADGSLPAVLSAVAGEPGLRLRGLMTVAPPSWEPVRAFERFGEIAERVRRDHPEAAWLSAGMSGDLEAAVGCGSTHVRVGSALLGKRAPLR